MLFTNGSKVLIKWEVDDKLALFFFPVYGQHFHEPRL